MCYNYIVAKYNQEKIMKRYVKFAALVLAILMLPTFAACDLTSNAPSESTPSDTPESTPEETPADTPADTEPMNKFERTSYTIKNNADKVKVTGRTSLGVYGYALDWSASAIEFNATCKGNVSVKMTASGSSVFAVFVNGECTKNITVSGSSKSYTIAENLEEGTYHFRLFKITGVQSTSSISHITVSGTLEEAPAEKQYLVEFIGDSITCGSGANYTAANQDTSYHAELSWAYLLSQSLNVDYTVVAIGGIGVAHSNSSHDGRTMNDLYPLTCYYRDAKAEYTAERKADLVIIGLNTNDGNTPTQSDYTAAAMKLINAVKKVHGDDVKILWVSTMMYGPNNCDYWAKSILTSLGGEAAGYYFTTGRPNNLGGNTHPNADGHLTNAEMVKTFIDSKKILK